MDDLFEKWERGESITRKIVSGGSTNGRIRTEYEEIKYTEVKVPEQTTKYAKQFVDRLRDKIWEVSSSRKYCSFDDGIYQMIEIIFFSAFQR